MICPKCGGSGKVIRYTFFLVTKAKVITCGRCKGSGNVSDEESKVEQKPISPEQVALIRELEKKVKDFNDKQRI